MASPVLLDTGPLVAFVNRRDRYHGWAKQTWNQVELPLLTCEAVVTEACFLLQSAYSGRETVLSMIADGIVQIPFQLEREIDRVKELLIRYKSVPMSLADACLVRMAELYSGSSVLTIDRDFTIYRQHRDQAIATVMPTLT
jgi:predicted nucleic acid-binding protein